MSEKHATIAIASPGARQESLRTILSAVDQLNLVATASGALTGWQMVRDLAPALVVIEGSLPEDEVALLLHYLQANVVDVCTLVIASTQHQARAALAAGASAVASSHDTLDDLDLVVSRLVAQRSVHGLLSG
jgi:DNA-binding NarL/FixJ family response regulator